MEQNIKEKVLATLGPPDFQLIYKQIKEGAIDNLTQLLFGQYFINNYNLDLVGRLNQLNLLEIALQNNQEIFIILSKIIYKSQYSIITAKCYEIISYLMPISEIYASSAMFTVILDRYKPLFPNIPQIQINANANEYPYIGLFIRGIEHESQEVRINALKCIKTHCLKYDSLFSKIIEYILDLLNDLTKEVQVFAMSFLTQIMKEMMAFKLYSYYSVKNEKELINIFQQISKLDNIGDKYKLYKYMFKFSVKNQRLCREVSSILIDSIKGSFDVYINRLIASLLAGCESITNNDTINKMIREHWLNFMTITKSILNPFLDIYKSYNFPETLAINHLFSLHSCFKQVSHLDIYKFTALNRYFNIIIKMLNIFQLVNQELPDGIERVEINDVVCELVVEIIVLLSQYIKLNSNFRKQLLYLVYSMLILYNTLPNRKRVISVDEIINSLCSIFDVEMNLSQIVYNTPKDISELVLKEYNFSFVDYIGISNRVIHNMHLSIKELTFVTFYYNSKYPLDVTIVYENKNFLKYNCLLHIFTSDNQLNEVESINTMNLAKLEMPFYISLKKTETPINITLNLIPDFPQCITNISDLDNFTIFSCSYVIKPD